MYNTTETLTLALLTITVISAEMTVAMRWPKPIKPAKPAKFSVWVRYRKGQPFRCELSGMSMNDAAFRASRFARHYPAMSLPDGIDPNKIVPPIDQILPDLDLDSLLEDPNQK